MSTIMHKHTGSSVRAKPTNMKQSKRNRQGHDVSSIVKQGGVQRLLCSRFTICCTIRGLYPSFGQTVFKRKIYEICFCTKLLTDGGVCLLMCLSIYL